MRAESTAATAHAIECRRTWSASCSRRSAGISFESRNPRMRYRGSRITAAATTGPNSDPRPTSSTPATSVAPAAQASFSNLSVQRSFFNKRNFAAEAESLSALEVFAVRADLDTESAKHLRRRIGEKQAQKFDVFVWKRRCAQDKRRPVPTRSLLLFDFLQPSGFALQSAQVVKLGATDLGRSNHVDLVDDLGIDGENTLHTLAKTDFAHREARLRATRPRNHDAFKRLQALFFAFSDLHQHLDGIAGPKLRNIRTPRFRQQFFDNWIAHKFPFLILIFRRNGPSLVSVSALIQLDLG